MPKRRVVKSDEPQACIAVLSPTCVTGVLPRQPAIKHVALLVDGTAVDCVAVTPAAGGATFRLTLPPLLLGQTLDVADADTMQSVLAAPVDFAAARCVTWIGGAVARGRVAGSFSLTGDAAPPGPVPVTFRLPDETIAAGFAHRAGGVFQFDLPLRRLPRLGEAAPVTALAAGQEMPAGLRFDFANAGWIGYADPTDEPMVRGWAVNTADPAQPVTLDLRANGRTVATGVTALPRDDIRALGFDTPGAGFQIEFPPGLPAFDDLTIEVLIAGTELRLTNTPYIRPGANGITGSFDGMEGLHAVGWVVNLRDPATPLVVEAVCEGAVVGRAIASNIRHDVRSAGLPTAVCGFRLAAMRPLNEIYGRDIFIRVVGTDYVLPGSPRPASNTVISYLTRVLQMPDALKRRLAMRMAERTRGMTVSIIMPVYNTPQAWLMEALGSVAAQWSPDWELICVNDGSTEPHVKPLLDAVARRDKRVRVLHSQDNVGIARGVNFGLRVARGDYVTFLDHDDVLEPDAVYHLIMAAKQSRADLIYSDEALTSDNINAIIEVRARPAFSHDYYMSHPYFVHMVCVRAEIARQIGGWDERLAISADVDFVLRVIEQSGAVAHVPRMLYRWRTHASSTGHSKQAQVMAATRSALSRHVATIAPGAVVRDGIGFNNFRIDWPDDGGEVLIVIPTKNRGDLVKQAIDSIERTAAGAKYRIVVVDHDSDDPKSLRYFKRLAAKHVVMPYSGVFNYARINNAAVRAHGGSSPYILLMNNDVEALQPGWLQRLRSLCARPDVGIAGPLLLYGDGRVQHAGVLVGFAGAAEHVGKFVDPYLANGEREPGYNSTLICTRDYSAVTAACMMIRRDAWDAVGGFDERFAIGFNDTDLCLRVGEAGYHVLYDPHVVLSHHESATRSTDGSLKHPDDNKRLHARWARFFTHGDPFYSPALSPVMDHGLRSDAGCKGRMAVRTIDLKRPVQRAPARQRKTRAKIAAE